ncbi:MAG: phosphatidic acid phosphatase, partial [Acidobacteria bacterium]|nr:phosphatidic acid phosphatase [Acidobacteriota bacterium]
LDGDRPSPREPLEVVDEALTTLESGRSDGSELQDLALAFAEDLRAAAGEDANAEAVSLVKVMRRDRQRVLGRELLPAEELRRHHRRTFTLSVDLMLRAGGAELRATDVPELVEALGWCSTVRDLEEDLEAGLVNLPAEVCRALGAEDPSELGYPGLIRQPATLEWLGEEHRRALRLLDRTDLRLEDLRGQSGYRILRLFSHSIRRFARHRFPEKFPQVV